MPIRSSGSGTAISTRLGLTPGAAGWEPPASLTGLIERARRHLPSFARGTSVNRRDVEALAEAFGSVIRRASIERDAFSLPMHRGPHYIVVRRDLDDEQVRYLVLREIAFLDLRARRPSRNLSLTREETEVAALFALAGLLDHRALAMDGPRLRRCLERLIPSWEDEADLGARWLACRAKQLRLFLPMREAPVD